MSKSDIATVSVEPNTINADGKAFRGDASARIVLRIAMIAGIPLLGLTLYLLAQIALMYS